jgi:hypothetical protein
MLNKSRSLSLNTKYRSRIPIAFFTFPDYIAQFTLYLCFSSRRHQCYTIVEEQIRFSSIIDQSGMNGERSSFLDNLPDGKTHQ